MLSLVIPTYNERRNIIALVQRVVRTLEKVLDSFEVIVVDDDSPDKTWEVVQELAKEHPYLKVIRRREERGLATAVVAGWKAARGEILGVIDGDLQHPPEILAKLIQAISTTPAEIVVASRHVSEGGVSDWSLIRRLVSWGATGLATLAIPGVLRNVRDPMSGYFLLRRSVIKSAQLNPTGYKILLEVLAKGTYRSVQEVPYVFEERKEGSSKLGPRQYREYLLHLGRLAKETGELERFLRFCTVGTSGVIVNEAVLWGLSSPGPLDYRYASVIAVEVAIITNFLLNEFWTFRDKANQLGSENRFHRFIKFNVICSFGGILNTMTLWGLTELAGLYYLISNLFGVGVSTLSNYFINANVTWTASLKSQLNAPIDTSEKEFKTADLADEEN